MRPWAVVLAVLVTLAVMALGLIAGRWQYGRYETRLDALTRYSEGQALPLVEWDTLLEDGNAHALDAAEWRQVGVTGRFDLASVTQLRGRTVEGTASLQYLAWFLTDHGALLVNTGWLPRADATTVHLPQGTVRLEGVMRVQEADDGKRGEDGATRILAAQMPPPSEGEALPGWLMLRSPCEDGCLGTAMHPVPLPQLSLGPHLSYAYQWWLLMVVAPIAAVVLLRRDAQHAREAAARQAAAREPASASAPRPAPARATVTRWAQRLKDTTDEDVEDAL